MFTRMDFMFDNFFVNAIVEFAIVDENLSELFHFVYYETVLSDEILHFNSTSKKSIIDGKNPFGEGKNLFLKLRNFI